MDIFSNIKNVQNTTYDNKHVTHTNENMYRQKIEKNFETDNKDLIKKKSTEDIKKELEHLTEQLNKEMNPLNTDLEFKYNDKIDNFSVFVIDKKTDKIIREFPPKEALRLMEKMRELVGMLFDKKG